MIATILSLNGGLLTTILCIHNQYLVTINSQIKLSVCLSVCLCTKAQSLSKTALLLSRTFKHTQVLNMKHHSIFHRYYVTKIPCGH